MVEAMQKYRKTGRFNPGMDFLIRREDIDLRSLLLQATSMVKRDRVRVEVGEMRYVGDAECLTRVFENLASNASHFMGENGLLVVRATCEGAGQQTKITFANDGPRLAAELIPRIFDVGFSTRPGGHGFGLAIVRELLALHGGHVNLRTDREWTIFEVVLPDATAGRRLL